MTQRSRRRWLLGLLTLIGIVAGGYGWLRAHQPDRRLQQLLIQLPRSATDPRFPVQVLEVWAPTCAPCVARITALNKVQARYGRQAEFLALTAAAEEQVTDLLKTRAETFAFSVLPGQPAIAAYLLAQSPVPHPALPVIAVVRRGRIVNYIAGPQATAGRLDSLLQQEL